MNFLWFNCYYVLAGLIYFLLVWWDTHSSEGSTEAEEIVADVTWATGVSRERVKVLIYVISFIFGFALLPMEIYSSVVKE